jgi:hypothetical protein
VVDGHTPTAARKPDLLLKSMEEGPLTAAVFSDEERVPLFFISDSGEISTPPEENTSVS